MKSAYDIIRKPVITERSMSGIGENKYVFEVQADANKVEIKKEVEALYDVTVTDVNTCVYAGKNKSRYTRSGLLKGRTNAFKKAIVTLKEGDTIDFYSNI